MGWVHEASYCAATWLFNSFDLFIYSFRNPGMGGFFFFFFFFGLIRCIARLPVLAEFGVLEDRSL